ncbi:MAG TPA: 50S ribosomal protein L27 [bacterium]|nr:50S ribosomal protein L27 [bacterium]
MAHTKSAGKTKNGRDSNGQRRGIKHYAGETVHAGEIIVRQCGTKWHAGDNVRKAKDDTLYAAVNGTVSFQKKKVKKFTGRLEQRTFVHVAS